MTDTMTTATAVYTRRMVTPVDVDEDKGILVGRIIPFGEVAHIREHGEEFDECFLPGCTARLRQVMERVGHHFLRLQLDHDEPGTVRQLGYGKAMSERDDGVVAEFQLYTKRHDYDLVREMLATAYRGLSVGFADIVPPKVDGDLVSRRQVNIEHVASVPLPAYPSAGVLEFRNADGVPDLGTPHLDAARALLAELRAASGPLRSETTPV